MWLDQTLDLGTVKINLTEQLIPPTMKLTLPNLGKKNMTLDYLRIYAPYLPNIGRLAMKDELFKNTRKSGSTKVLLD